MEKKPFGKLADGAEVTLYSFTNKNGASLTVMDLGATVVNVVVLDRDGNPVDVVLGYDTPQEYVDGGCYFGAVIAPNGNRIDKGRFSIGEKTYQLPINDNENNLHSGPHGADEKIWEVSAIDEEANSISFHIVIPDGTNGFPGNIDTTVTYTLTEDNAVTIHYEATSDQDTIANMTNHTYFNLAGHASGSIEDQTLMLTADSYTPVIDFQAIPTGEITPVTGTPMDFLTAKKIGLDIDAEFEQLKFVGGYDHNYVLPDGGGAVQKIAEACSEESGICMEVFTDCCCVQFYAGNGITDQPGKNGVTYHKRQGFCLESQFAPNAINDPAFRSPVLKAGEKYDTQTSYRFSVK
ncbi:MAG: galactose mutarotase [Lachnospiraceae bacterium]|nr:galactose mutarotase [Lachnospiraceae bacterium]MCD7956719.1 galactose mutarotase [Lachnospiraceae bacterium]